MLVKMFENLHQPEYFFNYVRCDCWNVLIGLFLQITGTSNTFYYYSDPYIQHIFKKMFLATIQNYYFLKIHVINMKQKASI